jgi:hypothetical protein
MIFDSYPPWNWERLNMALKLWLDVGAFVALTTHLVSFKDYCISDDMVLNRCLIFSQKTLYGKYQVSDVSPGPLVCFRVNIEGWRFWNDLWTLLFLYSSLRITIYMFSSIPNSTWRAGLIWTTFNLSRDDIYFSQ